MESPGQSKVRATAIPGHHTHTHTVYVFSSALTARSARSVLAGPRDRLRHPDTAYQKSAIHSLKHGLADASNYILELAAAVCTAIPPLSVQFVQTFIYPIRCMDLTLPEFGFTSTLFLQTSPWESLRVANNTWRPFIQCK